MSESAVFTTAMSSINIAVATHTTVRVQRWVGTWGSLWESGEAGSCRTLTRAGPRATSGDPLGARGSACWPHRGRCGYPAARERRGVRAPASTGATVTGIPLRTAVPVSGSTAASSVRTLEFDARVGARDGHVGAVAVVAPAVGERDDAGPDVVGDLDRRVDRADARARSSPGRRRSARGARRRRGARAACSAPGPRTSSGRLCIQELLERRSRRPIRTIPSASASACVGERGVQARDVGDQRRRRQLDLPGRRAQHLGHARLQRAEVDAVRLRPPGRRASARTGRCGASGRSGARCRRAAPARRTHSSTSRPCQGECASPTSRPIAARTTKSSIARDVGVRALAGGDADQPQDRLPLVGQPVRALQHRRRVVGVVAHREALEDEVEVRLLQRRRARAGSRRRGASSR